MATRYSLFPVLTIALLIGPVLAGLAATILPAFGFFPALGGEQFSLTPFQELLSQPALTQSAWLSLKTGFISTLLALIIVAIFLANWHSTKSFEIVRSSISPLLSVPHAAAAFGLAFLLAPSGWFIRIISPELTGFTQPPAYLFPADRGGWSLILGLTLKEIPFLLLVSLAAWPQLNASNKFKVATGFGYGRTLSFLHAIWPQLYGQIRLAIFAVLAFASSVVDVALIMGPTTPAPLAVRLLDWMNDPDLNKKFLASAGAVLQLSMTAATILLWLGLEELGAKIRNWLVTGGWRLPRDQGFRHTSITLMSVSILALFLGLFVLGIWSVAGLWQFPDILPQSFTMKHWIKQIGPISNPVQNSLLIGATSVIWAVLLAISWLESEHRSGKKMRRAMFWVIYLPLLIPQISFVFGLQLLTLVSGLEASLLALIWVHLVFVLPYIFLSLSEPWRVMDPRLAQLSAGLGKNPWRFFFSIRLPMLIRAILTAGAIGFAVSIAQYLPTLLIGSGRFPTVTTEAVALTSGGNRRIIGVYAFLQLCLPMIGFIIALIVPAAMFRKRRDMFT